MERKAYWFPPEADNLVDAYRVVQKAAKSVVSAMKELQELKKHAESFKAVGNESSRTRLIQGLDKHSEELRGFVDSLNDLADKGLRMRNFVNDAFHNPTRTDPSGSRPFGQPAMGFSASSYTYDRR